MKKNIPLLVFGLFILIALAFVLCTLTVWAFMSNQGKTLCLILMLGAFFSCSASITVLTIFITHWISRLKKKAKIKRLRFSGALSFIISNDAAIL